MNSLLKMKQLFIILFSLLFISLNISAKSKVTVKNQMEYIQQIKKVNFIYDGSLNLDIIYEGPSLKEMSLNESLKTLFNGLDFDWSVNGQYILLRKKKSHVLIRSNSQTLSGYVSEENGESLINATVLDATTGKGTITNEYGFFSITLPQGHHKLRVSYVGYDDKAEEINLDRDIQLPIRLKENSNLEEIVVHGNLNSPLYTTQTGKKSLTHNDISTEFSLMSSPDVIKTLQSSSGVAEGIEGATGLFVHGGNADENLFLIDGSPLYEVNHSLGLFSSFNTDVIKNVDFYKSGFPARYGGRTSSVVDVRTKDGDMEHTHGMYSIGMMDGRFQIDGPIVKGKTSFNFGIRRSWIDLILKPILAITNHNQGDDGEKFNIDYSFHDINGKITHIFSERSKAYLSVYSGIDNYTVKDDDSGSSNETSFTKNHFNWGNFNIAINWNYLFSPKVFANFAIVYSHNRAVYDYIDELANKNNNNVITDVDHEERHNHSTINDIGYRTEFDYRPNPQHHIRFGNNYTYHTFKPQTHSQLDYYGYIDERVDTINIHGHNYHIAQETSLYGEDDINLTEKWSANLGFNYTLFFISGKAFNTIDPRVAIKYQLSSRTSIKFSYTEMTQFVHKVANTYLDMPTDYWVPTTSRLHPMRSKQFAAGIYFQPSSKFVFSIEGFYKTTSHMLQYSNWMGFEPPANNWDKEVLDGKGKFYGIETDLCYNNKRLTFNASYTLSWNKRKFDDYYDGWFYDKFDNRHKVNLNLRYKAGRKMALYASWNLHSGNRITLPTQYINLPILPGEVYGETGYFYEKPNTISMPLYHRLDIGIDLHHTTKHGHERIWNISIYNVYCHLNTMYAIVDKGIYDDKYKIKTYGYMPIIPSVSYTIRF